MPGLGILTKLAFRIEGAELTGRGLVSAAYPTTEATADLEEVLLQDSDLVPFLSESVEEDHQWEPDETLIGTPGVSNLDRVGILGGGAIEVQGMYDGMDALICCILGFENPESGDSPVAQNSTALTSSALTAAGTWDDSGTPFASGDVGKFIQTLGAVAAEGQVRRISAYTDTNTVSITPNWTTGIGATPANTNTAVMAQEWLHLFEMANHLHDEKFSVADDGQDWTYPTTGVGTANDLMLRRGTLGVLKQSAVPWIFRSCMVNSMTISATAKAGVVFSFEMIPFNLDRASGTNTTGTAASWEWDHASPLFVANERIMFNDLQYFRMGTFAGGAMDATDNIAVNGFTVNVNNNLKADDQDAVSGNWRVAPARGATREVTGTITLPRYDSDTIVDWMKNATILQAHIRFDGSTIASSARRFEIFLSSLKIESEAIPVSGPSVLNQTFNFRCLIPASAPTFIASGNPTQNMTVPRSELMIRCLNQNPYSSLRDQQKEY